MAAAADDKSLQKRLLGPAAASETYRSSSCRRYGKASIAVLLFSAFAWCALFLQNYWVFLWHARGYQWNYFVWCLLNAQAFPHCPSYSWNIPKGSCRAGLEDFEDGGSATGDAAPRSLLLLTADGLSSVGAQSTFTSILHEAAKRRKKLEKKQNHSFRASDSKLGERGILYVCDANYDAHMFQPFAFEDCYKYCTHRTSELKALGASDVACTVLDITARSALISNTTAAYNYTDEEVAELLDASAGVFIEGGSTLYLLKSFRRKLDLGVARSTSFGDLVRERVFAGTLAYVGVSAGSILAGETASVARIWSDRGAEALHWNFSALGLVSRCVILPHFKPTQEGWMEEYAQELSAGLGGEPACPGCTVMGLPQCQPVAWGQVLGRWQLRYLCPSSR